MEDNKKNEVPSPHMLAKVEYTMELAKCQATGLASTLRTLLTLTSMCGMGDSEKDNAMAKFADSIETFAKFDIGGAK